MGAVTAAEWLAAVRPAFEAALAADLEARSEQPDHNTGGGRATLLSPKVPPQPPPPRARPGSGVS